MILLVKYLRRSLSLVELILLKLNSVTEFLQSIYVSGQHLVAASENTWIRAYVSDTQKKQFFLVFQKIITMSKQRRVPNICLENAWQLLFWQKYYLGASDW